METRLLEASAADAGKRFDAYLSKELSLSRSFSRQLIEDGDGTVNGRQVKPNYRLNPGDAIAVQLVVQEELKAEPQDIPLDIIYEDAHIIVVNKARGMVVHPVFMETRLLEASAADAGKRFDAYLSKELSLSRSFSRQLIEDGDGTVNGRQVKPNYRLNPGDAIAVQLVVQEELKAEPQDIPLDIIYEDAHIIVVNKARGMVVHPAAGNPDGTLVNALLFHCKGELSGINGVIRPGIVHRLDKDTSGVMVAAKTDEAHRGLAEQIKAHTAHRTYWALVHGNIVEERGTIDAPIGRHPKDRIKMAVVVKGGREAVTHFQVLKRFGDYTWVECRLETGRTHQIRVHMAYIHHPVVNDPLYGFKKDHFPIEGQALHSHCLDLVHPVTGQAMHFEAPAPADFMACLQQAERH